MKTLLLATDSQLVQEFRNGNDKALEFLIWRYKEKVFSSILFLVKDKYLAEDLFQDTFIKVVDMIRDGSYTEEGKFLAYVVRIAHNICIDHFRKIKRVQILNIPDNDAFEVAASYDNAADRNIIQFETSDRVRILLNQLPADQREVIVLRHFANLSFKDIATMTNCSINTALGRMRYALANLRKFLDEKQIAM